MRKLKVKFDHIATRRIELRTKAMEKITVKKAELLQILKTNFNKWKKFHEKAMKAYWCKVALAFEKASKKSLKHESDWYNGLVMYSPKDHTKDFETALKMVEMSVDTMIELTEETFRAYVMNEWEWRREYISQSSAYLGFTGPTGPCGDEGPSGEDSEDSF